MISEALTLPGNDCAWAHEDEGVLPPGPGLRQPDPEDAVCWPELWLGSCSLVDGKLVAQREDLELQRKAGAKNGKHAREEGNNHGTHDERP